jgi:hypothetical protein
MSEKVIRIGTTPNNMLCTVEVLAEWIKEGRIAALVICAVDKENNVLSAEIAENSLFTLLGAITDMQRTITDKIERR